MNSDLYANYLVQAIQHTLLIPKWLITANGDARCTRFYYITHGLRYVKTRLAHKSLTHAWRGQLASNHTYNAFYHIQAKLQWTRPKEFYLSDQKTTQKVVRRKESHLNQQTSANHKFKTPAWVCVLQNNWQGCVSLRMRAWKMQAIQWRICFICNANVNVSFIWTLRFKPQSLKP